jgi:hypothetical protein
VFNAATVDGNFGLIATGGGAGFDDVEVKTDDLAFITPASSLMAVAAGETDGRVLQLNEVAPVLDAAARRLSKSLGLSSQALAELFALDVGITDLPGLLLARTDGNSVEIDSDAAGHGWFVDPTPMDDVEFRRHIPGTGLAATPNSGAHGQIDLLSVIMHELGHVLDMSHESDQPFMAATLADGQRPDVMPVVSTAVVGEESSEHAHEFVNPTPAATHADGLRPGVLPVEVMAAAEKAVVHARQVVGSKPATAYADVRIFNEMYDAFINVDESHLLRQANVLTYSHALDDNYMIIDRDGEEEDVSTKTGNLLFDGDAGDEGVAQESVSAAGVAGEGGPSTGMIDWTARSGLVDRVKGLID